MFSKEEIEGFRKETPGVREVIHFNNAGASLQPLPVHKAVLHYLDYEHLNGGYKTSDVVFAVQLAHFYDAAAMLINAKPHEIAFMENASIGWQLAIHSIDFKKGDIILTSEHAYATNYLTYLKLEKSHGVKIKVIPSTESGEICLKTLEKKITKKVKLIAITHIPTNGGLINPAAEVGALAKQHDVLYLLDACQSVGQIEIDVKAIGCDFLSTTGRKYLRGPRGTGFLYVSERLLEQGIEPPFIDLSGANWETEESYSVRPDARRFENYESNYAGKYGLTVAIDYALSIGMDRIETQIIALANQLRKQLSEIEGVTVYDIGTRQGGLVSVGKAGVSREAIIKALNQEKINASSIWQNGTLLDMKKRNIGNDLVRLSVHYYNNQEELDKVCAVIEKL